MSISASTAPPIDSGSDDRMVIGCSTRANSSTSTANTMRMPVTMAMHEVGEQLGHDFGVADVDEMHALRQVLQRRQGVDLVFMRRAELHAVQVRLDGHAPALVVAAHAWSVPRRS